MSTRYFSHSERFMLLKADSHPTVFVFIHLSTTSNKCWFLIMLDFQKQPLEVFCKKGVLEFLQYLQENTCARVSFLIKLQASGPLLYSKSNIFRWTVQNFQKYFFYRIALDDCFWTFVNSFTDSSDYYNFSEVVLQAISALTHTTKRITDPKI